MLLRLDYVAQCSEVPEPMIDSIRIQDFKGHRDTALKLGRLTVLVGPNGSGKTSVLEALELQQRLATSDTRRVFRGNQAFEDLRRARAERIVLGSRGRSRDDSFSLDLDISGPHNMQIQWEKNGTPDTLHIGPNTQTPAFLKGLPPWDDDVPNALGRLGFYKFNAQNIANAAYSDNPSASVQYDGTNTAVALAALKLGDDEIFARIEEEMRQIVPSVKRVRIRPASVQRAKNDEVVGHKIYFDFRGAPGVPAHCASEGTLITLALLTVLHGPNRPNLILLDDFDQSLHPQAQMELVTLIKRLLDEFSDLQIVATTHSPYILDQLEPSDVHVFALREDGTVATRPLSEHPDAAKMKGALTTGQLWTLDQERTWVIEGQTP